MYPMIDESGIARAERRVMCPPYMPPLRPSSNFGPSWVFACPRSPGLNGFGDGHAAPTRAPDQLSKSHIEALKRSENVAPMLPRDPIHESRATGEPNRWHLNH